jgi:pimeloyl-ACP methyl ester carboxylesterase
MNARVVFIGGNGHCAARLAAARAALRRRALPGGEPPWDLVEPACPGFEDRPRAPDLSAFLDALSAEVGLHAAAAPGRVLVYATGIGGLLALCLRARCEWHEVPLLLQAPVLWGLERRRMPRLMRHPWTRGLLVGLFGVRPFRAWFARRYFVRPPPAPLRAAFFDGYARCPAAADFFAWLTPALLRRLEADFAEERGGLEKVSLWWGGRDRVVDLREWAWTRQALKADWPLHRFPDWGHYPMIDDPAGWVRAVTDELASLGMLPRLERPQAR